MGQVDTQWECSALNIISGEIHRLIKQNYVPSDEEFFLLTKQMILTENKYFFKQRKSGDK